MSGGGGIHIGNPDKFGFVWLLIAAFIIIIVFGALGTIPGIGGPANGTVLAELTLGPVGAETEATRSYAIGTFTVGDPQVETVKTIPQVSLGANLLSSDALETQVAVPEWLLGSARDASLTFGVLETNNYGDLVIEWNGKELSRGQAALGPNTILIPRELIKAQNTLRLTATGPSWRFWAGTVYILGNVQVGVRYGPAKLYGFDLAPADLQGFDRGELSFYASGSANLDVLVNGRSVSSSAPAGATTARFTIADAPLRAGTNILTLSVPQGFVTLQSAQLRIYTLGPGIARERSFNLTQEQLSIAARPVLRYEVSSMERPGALSFALNGRALPAQQPQLGGNSLALSQSDLRAGENLLSASGTGSFTIGAVKLVAER